MAEVLALAAGGVVAVLLLALQPPAPDPVLERLRPYRPRSRGASGHARASSGATAPSPVGGLAREVVTVVGRWGEAVAQTVSRAPLTLLPSARREVLGQRLAQAGYSGTAVGRFLGLKVVGLGLGGIILAGPGLLSGHLTGQVALLGLVGALLGWRLPEVWLVRRIATRQRQIVRALPDALDLLVICVEAGYGLEAALAQVARRMRGPLAEEIGRTLQAMALGKRRREALRDLAARTGVADLQSFVVALLQADQLGVSIAPVLRAQAETLRLRRRQRAEEQAAQAAVKMLFPLVLLIFPALLIVILGPAALRLIEFFGTTRPGG